MPRKNESPPIPTNTCPYIDHVIHMVDELKDLAQENKLRFAESLYELEHIRNSNDMLRDSGKYWYQKNKNNR